MNVDTMTALRALPEAAQRAALDAMKAEVRA